MSSSTNFCEIIQYLSKNSNYLYYSIVNIYEDVLRMMKITTKNVLYDYSLSYSKKIKK